MPLQDENILYLTMLWLGITSNLLAKLSVNVPCKANTNTACTDQGGARMHGACQQPGMGVAARKTCHNRLAPIQLTLTYPSQNPLESDVGDKRAPLLQRYSGRPYADGQQEHHRQLIAEREHKRDDPLTSYPHLSACA
jgi:hypothetical protein